MGSYRRLLVPGLVLLLAAALRFPSLGFDLDLHDPNRTLLSNHTDARGQVLELRQAVTENTLVPDEFLYRGPAGFLLFYALDSAALAVRAHSLPGGRDGALRELQANPALIALVHRFVSAAAGVLNVLLVMLLMQREFGRRAALCSGLVLAVAYLHVRDSQFGTVETLWGSTLVLGIDACYRLVSDPARRSYVRAGLLVGVAVAFKYFNAVLGLPLCLAHVLARMRARAEGRAPPPLSRLVLSLALVPLGFVLLFPGLFLGAWDNLVGRVGTGAESMGPKVDGFSQLLLLRFHLQKTLAVGLGEPVLLAALIGLVLAWRKGWQGRYLVLCVLGTLPTIFLTGSAQVRYGMAVLVMCAMPAGIALEEGMKRFGPVIGGLLVLLALTPSLARSLALERAWQHTDTRLLALQELRQRCAPGEQVLMVGLHREGPEPLHPQPFRLVNQLHAQFLGRFELQGILAAPPAWILWGQDRPYAPIPDEEALRTLVSERYREVVRFADRGGAELDFSFLMVPRAVEIPFESPWAVERPGPSMVLYELVAAEPPR